MILYTHTHTHGYSFLNDTKKERKSNLELLRIFSMILIIMGHFSYYGEFNFENAVTFNRIFVNILRIGGKIGVSCFVLISGYCMVDSKFKVKKVINLILEVLTYSLLGLIIAYIINPNSIGLKNILKSLFSITYGQYWFITTYIVLYLLSPFINKCINVLSKVEFKYLIFILLLIEVIIPTISTSEVNVHEIIIFIMLYIIGAYINKFPNDLFNSKKNIIYALILYNFIIVTVVILDLLSIRMDKIKDYTFYFAKFHSIPSILCSIFIFLSFKNMKDFYNKHINRIASTTLGIYLIHENMFMRPIIWKEIFKCNTYSNSQYLILNAIITIGSVFLIGMIVDFIRQQTFGKISDKISEHIIYQYENKT